MKKILIILFSVVFLGYDGYAKLWMPSILSDNMVLQQKTDALIWGWTTATSEKITVTGSWNNQPVTTKADQGIWAVKLLTPVAGGPYEITVRGHETIVLHNVMIGEVWVCSGQSNMEHTPLDGLLNAEEEIKQASYPEMRFFFIPRHKSSWPQDDTPGYWTECTPETMKHFSSVGYFFGRELIKKLSLPVGLIYSNWGGTPVEVWTKKELIENDPQLKAAAEKLSIIPWPSEPGVAYNAMIHPITRFSIAGVIWYQGESNVVNPFSYFRSFPLLIRSWRKEWGKEFPFYYVQIAPCNYKSFGIAAAIIRDAQLKTMAVVPNTGMVVTNDIGDLKNIHPLNKQEVGRRLALWALAKAYGRDNIVYSGPIYKSMEIKGKKAIISFDYTDGGLMKKGEELTEFYIAGEDKVFRQAKAKIVDKTVMVYSQEVKKPVAVRFAFSDTAQPNLFNNAGLPASAFRTDNWKIELK